MRPFPRFLCRIVALVALGTCPAFAAPADPDAGAPPPHAEDTLVPPVLKTHPEAPYPPEALQLRLEANIGLELTVDETGKVVDAKVTSSAGHGFDEAAL